MIELQKIYKTYRTHSGPNVVLDGVDALFPSGQSVGVLGRNGAGKSTLLRILAGVESADSGAVVRQGRVSWPIGFSGGFSASLSGEENSRFIARIYGEDVDRVVSFAMNFAELGRYFFEPVKTYSSGMRARLAFGLSMAVDFDTYLVDEVTAVGDKAFQEKCRRAFAERQARASVIIVSHQMRTIRSYCTSCVVLERGKLYSFDRLKDAARFYDEKVSA
jgi:capsular polysaccharide transport system ATP-binding protein